MVLGAAADLRRPLELQPSSGSEFLLRDLTVGIPAARPHGRNSCCEISRQEFLLRDLAAGIRAARTLCTDLT